jgi:hypothetical protein
MVDKRYIQVLENITRELESKQMRDYICPLFMIHMSHAMKTKTDLVVLEAYPEFNIWIDKVGKELHQSYTKYDPWFNDIYRSARDGVRYKLLSNMDKVDILNKYIKSLKINKGE